MGLGMFQKHRREREAVIETELVQSLQESLDAAETDEERVEYQARLDRISGAVAASQEALDARKDPSAHGVEVVEWTGDNETKQVAPTAADNGGLGNAGVDGDGTPAQEPQEPAEDAKPLGNASTDTWRAYALTQGHSAESLDGLNRDAIRDLFA